MARDKTTRPAFRVSATAKLNLRTTEALAFVQESLYEAMQEVVVIDIVSTAKELSPVLAVPTKERYPGENRDSIDSHVRHSKKGVSATVFTGSGYGGFLELGTAKMTARPYIYPAFEIHIGKLPSLTKEAIGNFAPKENKPGG